MFVLTMNQAKAETNVSVTTNTGGNTINGVSTSGTSTSHTYINVNGKEYVNDDSGEAHDIVDDSNGGHVEVHVNSNNTTTTQSQSKQSTSAQTTTVTPAPTEDIQPTIAKKKEEIKAEIAKVKSDMKQEHQSMLERFFSGMFAGFGSLFKVFAKS
jgi:hypothetical protein